MPDTKVLQQLEFAQIEHRDANLTALAAIGPKKKRPLESGSELQVDAGGCISLHADSHLLLSPQPSPLMKTILSAELNKCGALNSESLSGNESGGCRSPSRTSKYHCITLLIFLDSAEEKSLPGIAF
ncbi:hypothetical protein P7K49_014496 [Saguinus oedipus]|uniref:Uncharacterized protein n=1 Tax=Saguinus oedipus TaxID=9490 RepID=A0ABQ9VIX9_SAGOE|nr:hypothetical protein P7K49_014496 [Saguinus oedipus]